MNLVSYTFNAPRADPERSEGPRRFIFLLIYFYVICLLYLYIFILL